MTKTGLRPGLKLPPRVGGASTKRRVPVRTGAGLKLPPKPGAPRPAASAASPASPASPQSPASPDAKDDKTKKPAETGKAPDEKGKKSDDTSKKPDDKGKAPDGKDGDKKPKKRRSPVRFLFTLLVMLASMAAAARFRADELERGSSRAKPAAPDIELPDTVQWLRVGVLEGLSCHVVFSKNKETGERDVLLAHPVREEPAAPGAAPAKHKGPRVRRFLLFRPAPVEPAVGEPVRLVHSGVKKAAVADVSEEETVEEPAAVEAAPEPEEAPKKAEIVKRVPADLFEDALLETVRMLRTMPIEEARRAAVNSFTDIARKERDRDCYAVINALQAAQNWDELVIDTIVDHPDPAGRTVKVGHTTHKIRPPYNQEPGAVICNRIVKGHTLRNQRIPVAEMSPQEKLRIVRSEPPDPSRRDALYSRAFLELVYGSPKTFRDFVEKHKRIEGMKVFYVVYELERMK